MIESLRGEVDALRAENAELRAKNGEVHAENADLRARLNRDSTNSSKPPSSDPPWKPPAQRRRKGRKRGGQPGHGGHHRELVEANEVVVVKPEQCSGCGAELAGEDVSPWRHQVAEIPRVIAQVTEYQLHTLRCACCGTATVATLPEGVPYSAFGPRLQSMVAVCSGVYRMSKRSIEELFEDFFNVRVSLGSVSNLEAATSDALAPQYEKAIAKVRRARVLHVDETSWRLAARRAWMWVVVTAATAVFCIRRTRSAQVAKELIGTGFSGVLVADQYPGYHWVLDRRRQLCWAHLIRHFRALLDYEDAKAFGERLLGLTEKIFSAWHRSRSRVISWPELVAETAPTQEEFRLLLGEGAASPCQRVRVMCKGLLRHETAMWTFLRRSGVQPTNNAAERALRHPVMWRKTSFGTDSERGARFAERILTIVATLRLQRRHVLDYIADACRAATSAAPPPELFLAGA